MTTALTLVPNGTTSVDWSNELRGAQMLLKSGLAPKSLQTPEAAMFVIMVGRDLGLTATQSLRSVQVIQGKVEIAADMQLALFKKDGGKASWKTLTDTVAELMLVHPNGDQHTERFTMDDAKRAGLTGDNWRKYPKAMLRSRAITAGMKSIGFDVLAGVYAPGEIGGDEPIPAPVPAEELPTVEATVTDAPALPAPVEPEAPAVTELPTTLPKWKDYEFAMVRIADAPMEELQRLAKWRPAKNADSYEPLKEAIRLEITRRVKAVNGRGAKHASNDFEAAPAVDETDDLPF
jgi:hypothetical protein